ARLVEHKGLSGLQHDVAGIVRLGDPDGAFAALDREPLAVVDIEQFAGIQANGAIGEMPRHIGFPCMTGAHVIQSMDSPDAARNMHRPLARLKRAFLTPVMSFTNAKQAL